MENVDKELLKSDLLINSEENLLQEKLQQKIHELIEFIGADPESFQSVLIAQIIATSLKMGQEGFAMGQLKLMTRAFKEMRYAYRVFNKYPVNKRISIFGSSRTPESHPDYQAAKFFGAAMANLNWVCITGAADGIMRAGLEGAEKESRFGLSIRLPFESPSNSLLAGDPKLINFRYFFTRKLMFLSHSDAIAAFPGGVGTQDELFEVLTLMQTGKANILPVVLIEGENGSYWRAWQDYLCQNLLVNGWISPEDLNLFYLSSSVNDAVAHIQQFYRRYHSSRYVKDVLVIRLLSTLTDQQVEQLNQEFSLLLKEGKMYLTKPLQEETDHLELPRLAFEHNRRYFGLLRLLIDKINSF
ncbi:Uncharacterized protein PRO82_002156 [Candidatus Protochlamydia amoebophila]|uniref:LOG family protein n=1 Tax=Candidatus Protochlamydia amoebophila TaxID=362787 RepID=UPI001BC97CAE|nr:LOG family protein [Candidatus Protochlamydia amoebophila]MBS4164821.1 Uncharacterized protein [Candidatus Protochlamydia amoebophila]